MKPKRTARIYILLWLVILLSVVSGAGAQGARHVDVLEIEGPVTPIMISYIERGIRTAEDDGAEALIIKLDTPGGQIDQMKEIVQALLDADVPTVVYVYPRGAYAASAGRPRRGHVPRHNHRCG
jgi:membrane-bound serine protease (ClpP class)